MATYTITTLEQLQKMYDHLDDECVLANDIDASDTYSENYGDGVYQGFIPVGTEAAPFQGSFDGGGYSITNLYINRQATEYVGLFGYVSSQAQKIVNGTFTGSAASWTLGSGWAYGTNNVTKNADGTGTLKQASATMSTPIVSGETYTLIFTLSSWTAAGTCVPTCGGVTLSSRSTAATFSEEFTAVSDGDLEFTPSDTSRFIIDSVYLYRKHTFKDVNVINANISGLIYCGVMLGYAEGISGYPIIISNMQTSGSVYSAEDRGGSLAPTGGFAGSIINCDVDDCSSDADVSTISYGIMGGFVGSIGSCTIDNCKSAGSILWTGTASGTPKIGGFAGNYGATTANTCSANCGIILLNTQTSSTEKIGGFIGTGHTGTVNQCISYTNIYKLPSTASYMGGFVGAPSFSGDTISFTKCAAVGAIIWVNPGIDTNPVDIGGFAGQHSGTGTISDCYSHIDICKTGMTGTGTGIKIGGFNGISASSVTRCYSTGYVPDIDTYGGGFIGHKTSGTTTYCYWDTETSGYTDGVGTGTETGITGKTTAEMKVQTTYDTFDFDTVWEITTFEQGALAPTNLTVWLSQVDDYDSFAEGTNDAEAFTVIVPSTNEIRWVQSLESLLVGTSGDEWRIGSNKLETAITPTNYKVEQQTEYGSSRVQPIKINASLIYVDYVGRKLREMSFTGDKYESLDLTVLSEDITVGGITTIARQKNPDSIIWCTLETGELISFTYDRSQNVLAWSEHPLGGTDVEVQSVSVSPSTTEDEVYLTVQRTVNSATVIYWEKLAPRIFDTSNDAYFVDCGITFDTATSKAISAFADYSSTVTGATKVTSAAHTLTTGQQVIIDGTTNYDGTYTATVINTTEIYIMKAYVANDATGSLYIPVTAITGLTHLEGETVQVLGDGVVLDEEVVASGAITASTAILKAQVGLPYTWKVSPMRLVVSGEDGTSFGSHIRVSEMVVSFLNTGDADFYTTNSTETLAINFSDERWTNEELITDLFTGDVVVSMPGGHSAQTPIVITGSEPLPATVRCIIARAEQTGR